MPGWIEAVTRDLTCPTLTVYLTALIACLHYALDHGCNQSLRASGANPLEDWWRPWTYGLAHADDDHLWGNLVGFAAYGAWFEAVHGTPALGALVGLALPCGSLAHVMVSDHYLWGYSAVVFGLFVCPLVSLALNWHQMQLRWLRLAVYAPLAVVIVVDQVYADDQISVECHAAGAVAGALVALVLGRNLVERTWELAAAWLAVAAFVIGAAVAVAVDPEVWIYAVAVAVPALACLAPRVALRPVDYHKSLLFT